MIDFKAVKPMAMINKLLGKSDGLLLGLDISNVSVKLLELQQKGASFIVRSHAVVPLADDAVVEKNIINPEAVSEALRQLIKKARPATTKAAVAIADSSVISKVIAMDEDLDEEEMELQIALEADKHIPFPLEELSLDFQVLGPNAKQQGMVDVLLVACRNDQVASRVHCAADAGLKIEVVDVQSYAMQRACRLLQSNLLQQGHEKTVAVLDIGATVTNLTVLHDMKTVFTRADTFGGEQLTRDIQRYYNMSYQEAGQLKRSVSPPEDYYANVLQPFCEESVLHVRRALQYFFSASQENRIDQIILAGGTSSTQNLAESIEQEIGIATEVANPFRHMELEEKVDANVLLREAPSLMQCCGLALRGANL